MTAVAKATKQEPATTGGSDGLETALKPKGFTCLRHCHVPGVRRGTVDHVVIGPSGVWVVHELEHEVRDVDVRAVRDHADAVQKALACRPPRTVLSVGIAALPGGADERDGVVIIGSNRTADLIRNAAIALRPEGVQRLVAKARAATEPAKKEKQAQEKRKRRWPKRVLLAVVLVAGVAALVPVARGALSGDEPAADAVWDTGIVVGFECRHPGAGWSQVISWTGVDDVRTVSWSSTPNGPWSAMPAFGAQAVRDGVAPSDRSHVRVERTGDGGKIVDAVAAATAPDQPC